MNVFFKKYYLCFLTRPVMNNALLHFDVVDFRVWDGFELSVAGRTLDFVSN